MKRKRWSVLAAAAGLVACGLAGCGSTPLSTGDHVTLKYWLWDSSQMPAYQACIDQFEKDNPTISVNLEQYGWDDYWTQITAGMVAEAAPDVFIDHTGQFGKFMSYGQLLDLKPYIDRDGIDLDQYEDGLAQLWEAPDGGVYALPKDWDSEAVFYNEKMVTEAGYTKEDLWNLTWNPDDGGTFEKFIAHLTVDVNGVRGDEPGFDKNNVKTYGFSFNDSGAGYGQTQWSPFLLTTGWTYADTNPWGTVWNYSDERFKKTLTWHHSLIEKGYMPSLAKVSSGIGPLDSLKAGVYATLVEGSWQVNNVKNAPVKLQVAPTPIGPNGQRASILNSVGDSIYKGTPHPEEAWKFVKHLASPQCQKKVAEFGVVFPAISEASDAAVKTFEANGFDATAFSTHVSEGTGVTSPVSDRWAQLQSIMQPVTDEIMSGGSVDLLDEATQRVNETMKRSIAAKK